jgi:hypothetical protein
MSDNNTDPAQITDMQVRERIAELEAENKEIWQTLACSRQIVSKLEADSLNEFIEFVKAKKGLDGRTKLMIHALGIAFKQTDGE